ncbi:extracellular solute-binding protein [Microbacterium amylolyticum]|uniref:extracellular solute-binding protein n=1 Tax=Microbacterium amylolyticum TaxID=936337 RepID=UPI00361613D9
MEHLAHLAGWRHPWSVDGTDLTIDLENDAATQRFTDLWQPLIDDEVLAPINGWTDEWFQGMANGTIASLVIGAWMPANLIGNVPDGAGDWRVAPMPQWEAGAAASSENGGSSLAVPTDAQNKELAYAFIEYANASTDGVQMRLDDGAFPATTEHLESAAFQDVEWDYFGGQKINEVLAQSSADVVEGWQYLPFQVYANTIYGDTAGQAYLGSTTLADGLAGWQNAMKSYAAEQGFGIE